MAQFKNSEHLVQGNASAFDKEWRGGEVVVNAGIYRCKNCGDEIVLDKRTAIPQNHHQHLLVGPVVWKMLVFAQKHPTRA